jgi:hypothetical protein
MHAALTQKRLRRTEAGAAVDRLHREIDAIAGYRASQTLPGCPADLDNVSSSALHTKKIVSTSLGGSREPGCAVLALNLLENCWLFNPHRHSQVWPIEA